MCPPLAVPDLVVDMRARRMSGAAEVAELVALVQHLPHPRRDALQVAVEVRPAVDVVRDDGIAVAAARARENDLLPRRGRQHRGAQLAGEVDGGMHPALIEQARHAAVGERHDEFRAPARRRRAAARPADRRRGCTRGPGSATATSAGGRARCASASRQRAGGPRSAGPRAPARPCAPPASPAPAWPSRRAEPSSPPAAAPWSRQRIGIRHRRDRCPGQAAGFTDRARGEVRHERRRSMVRSRRASSLGYSRARQMPHLRAPSAGTRPATAPRSWSWRTWDVPAGAHARCCGTLEESLIATRKWQPAARAPRTPPRLLRQPTTAPPRKRVPSSRKTATSLAPRHQKSPTTAYRCDLLRICRPSPTSTEGRVLRVVLHRRPHQQRG